MRHVHLVADRIRLSGEDREILAREDLAEVVSDHT